MASMGTHQFCRYQDLNMKVIVAVIFAIGSASALGSGPYLPSGWRPQGPAFYLPTEVQKPAVNPIKDLLFYEAEASGSERLRDYGPPKETLIAQALPDVATERSFYVLGNAEEQQLAKVNAEQRTESIQEATTESQHTEIEEQAQELNTDVTATNEAVTAKINVEVATEQVEVATEQVKVATEQVEVATEQVEVATEQVEDATEQVEVAEEKAEIVEAVSEVEASVAAVEEKLENVAVVEEKLKNIVVQGEEKIAKVVETVEGARNIAEALVNIEKEIKTEQVQQSIETVGELKVTQEGSDGQVPEGFLEYGPPGFREYGPPKEELREISANDVRRRRFSPKFRSSQNRKH